MNSKNLEAYLPTAEEIENMDPVDFENWIHEASREIQRRNEMRDPLFHLKKRISQIISDQDLQESERENKVLSEINKFFRLMNQPR